MASQVIDSLLQNVAPTRSVEPLPRAGDESGKFAPVLDRALRPGERPNPREAASDADDADVDAAPTPRAAERNDDEATASDAIEAESAESTADEETSSAPRDDDQDASEISAETAATAEAQAASIVVATDNSTGESGEVDVAPTLAAADTATESESDENLPQDGLPARNSATSGQTKQELGDARPVDGAVEIGDVQQVPVRNEKVRAKGVDAAHQSNRAEAVEQSAAPAAPEDAQTESAAPDTTQAITEEFAEKGRLASSQDAGEASTIVEPTAADGGDEPPLSDGDGREARHTEAHRPAETTEAAEIEKAAAPAEIGATPATDKVPDDHGTAPPAAAPSAAEAAPARGAAALAWSSTGQSIPTSAERGDADATGHVDRARFLGRVEGAIRSAQQRDGRVQVRLSPPELGALRIELTVQHGVLSARLEAETAAARNLLLDNLPALRDRLAQQDIRVERFDVDVRRDGGGSNQQGAQDRPASDPGWQGDGRRERPAARQAEATRGSRPVATRTNNDAALDVRV